MNLKNWIMTALVLLLIGLASMMASMVLSVCGKSAAASALLCSVWVWQCVAVCVTIYALIRYFMDN